MEGWFRRRQIGRTLTEREQQFVWALTRMLEDVWLSQMKPTAPGRAPARLSRALASMTRAPQLSVAGARPIKR